MRKLQIYVFAVLLPAVVVGINNVDVFPDNIVGATIMLVITCGIAGIFNYVSGNATQKIVRYVICAHFVICAILCANLSAHWILSRQMSAARKGVVERNAEEDRDDRRATERAERELALKKADTELEAARARANAAEARKLAQLPLSQRRAVAPKPEPTRAPVIAPLSLAPSGSAVASVSAPAPSVSRLTPEQVLEKWWPWLVALAIAEVAASIGAACILTGLWEWDRNKDGIPDHLQKPQAVPGK